MTEYWIGIGSPDKGTDSLQDKVNAKLHEGWKLYGTLVWNSGISVAMQAMTREIEIDTKNKTRAMNFEKVPTN